MKSGARTIKHIYFASLDIYLHSSIVTYLLIFISITNVSILTNPAYFVPPSCHCGILALRSRDFSEITLTAKHVFGCLHEKLENVE
jgi:hypothetical protein